MGTTVGSLSVELAAGTAVFERDLGKASGALNSAQARMNAILAKMEHGFRQVSKSTETATSSMVSLGIKGGLAVIGFQSLRAGVSRTMATMRDMEEQAKALGVSIDSRMASSAAGAVLGFDRLSFSVKSMSAAFATTTVAFGMAAVKWVESFEVVQKVAGFLGRTWDRLVELVTDNPVAAAIGEAVEEQKKLLAAEEAGLRFSREKRDIDMVFLENRAKEKASIDGTIDALEEQRAVMVRSNEVNRFHEALQRAGIQADNERAGEILNITNQIEKLTTAQQANIAEANRSAKELEDNRQAWTRYKESAAGALEDTLLRVNSLGEAVRALGMEIARAGLRRFVTGPIIDMIGGALGIPGARAEGGPVMAGMPYLVGERGPELIVPGRDGTVIPNGRFGGGGGPVFNIDARGASPAAVARLERMVVQLNGSIEGRAVGAVAKAGSRRPRR